MPNDVVAGRARAALLEKVLRKVRELASKAEDDYPDLAHPTDIIDVIDDALAELAAETAPQTAWQSIAIAPQDGSLVLTMASDWDRPCVLAWRDGRDSGRWDDDSGDSFQDYQPSHWMPLPARPTRRHE